MSPTGSEPGTGQDQGASESTVTVLVAFGANLVIALAKSVVGLVTGSASMVAEAAHSWADTGNQVLLLVADRKSRRPPDESHPFGYGRESYVWAMFAALGLFVAGGVVSLLRGVSQLTSDEPAESFTWAYVVLAIAFVFEGVSFVRAFQQTKRQARDRRRDVLEHALQTSDPTLRAVIAEDAAALVGLIIAAAGILLHQLTGSVVYDALGSILIGLLLVAVAVVLIDRNRRFLTGQQGDPELRAAALRLVRGLPGVARVTYLRLEFVGPGQVLLVASVDLEGEPVESRVAHTLRDLERRVEREGHIREAVVTLATPEEPSL